MYVNGIHVLALTAADIERLVDNKAPETRELEFKRDLPDDNKEFAKDASAFANTNGGCIVFGVDEGRDLQGRRTGLADTLFGVPPEKVEQAKATLIQVLRDSLDPALTTVEFSPTLDVRGKQVVVLGIAASLNRPHRVEVSGDKRFYSRSTSDKYQPDVPELRRMFLERGQWLREAKEYHELRVSDVVNGRLGPLESVGARIIAHVLPLGRLDAMMPLQPHEQNLRAKIIPLNVADRGRDWRFTGDGHRSYTTDGATIITYTEILRNGGSEGFGARRTFHLESHGRTYIRLEDMTADIIRFVKQALAVGNEWLGVAPPFAVFVSLEGFANSYRDSRTYDAMSQPFSHGCLTIPPVVIDSADADLLVALKPLLDVIWQAVNVAETPKSLLVLPTR